MKAIVTGLATLFFLLHLAGAVLACGDSDCRAPDPPPALWVLE